MSNFEIGDMFWGKSMSYPWWPCVIVPNEKNEIYRNRRNHGIQYHVQFLGPDYDVCWITNDFLIEYNGKEGFESFVEKQLTSNLSPKEKVKFDMRMSSTIQVVWVKACRDAEDLFLITRIDRLSKLPKPLAVEFVAPVLIIPKRNPSRGSITESNPDQSLESLDSSSNKSKSKKKPSKKLLLKGLFNEDDSDIEQDNRDVDIKKTKQRTNFKKILVSKELDNGTKPANDTDLKDSEIDLKIKKKKSVKRNLSIKSEYDDTEMEYPTKESSPGLDTDIEGRCFKAYMAKEMTYRISEISSRVKENELEMILQDQWAALDNDLKLQYLNDEGCYFGISKSKVSGRKIKIPSKLRLAEDIEKIKKSSSRKRVNEPLAKRHCSKSVASSSTLPMKTENVEDVMQTCVPLPETDAGRDTICEALWTSLALSDCSTEMMRIVVMKTVQEVGNICCYCFKPLSETDQTMVCKGPCQCCYHLFCAIQNKIIRSEDVSFCVYCNQRDDLCCICKNSKYMKKQTLIKCLKQDCQCYFHVTCIQFLTLYEGTTNEKDPELCLKHSCLTCSREDNKHSCNTAGPFVSCIKCPISYHNNLICIPAGCQIIGKTRIICYRHFDNTFVIKKTPQLFRCFVCFNEKATLKCCKCRALFHPKCMALATYTDLLRDYVCTSCKLEQPMFYGQVVWIETNKRWLPAEIVRPVKSELPDDDFDKFTKSLTVRHMESNQYSYSNRCELIAFSIGVSVLQDMINVNDPVVQLARIRDTLYWNWRGRLRPLESDKYSLVGQSDLMKHSVSALKISIPSVIQYESIDQNIIPDYIQKLLTLVHQSICTCSSSDGTCNDATCHNFQHCLECTDRTCSNESCNNRLFAQLLPDKRPIIILSSISDRGVKMEGAFTENQLLGECCGTLITETDVVRMTTGRGQLESVSYIFMMAGEVFLDMELVGNEWRHLNHSCEPNARLVCRNVDGILRLGVVSLKSIINEEITIDYREHLVLKYGFFCQCHSLNCCHLIGPTSIFATDRHLLSPQCCTRKSSVTPTLTTIATVATGDINNSDFNETVIDDRMIERTTCYKCTGHGEFITCDKSNCKKQYHLTCIEKAVRPVGLWLCPIHFCCHCNYAATVFCPKCPISCCKIHSALHSMHVCTNDEKRSKCADEDVIEVEESKLECVENEEMVQEDMEIYNEDCCANGNGDHNNEEREEMIICEENLRNVECVEMEVTEGMCEETVVTSVLSNGADMNENGVVDDPLGLTKDDLYQVCDLVPVAEESQEMKDCVPTDEMSDSQRLTENSVTTHQDHRFELHYDNLRYEIVPSKIEEMEDTIISPCIIDE